MSSLKKSTKQSQSNSPTPPSHLNKKALTAVYKDSGKCKKKKKIKEIKGRKIHDAYFTDTLIQNQNNKNVIY